MWIALGLTGESTLDKFMENNKGLKVLHMTRLIHFLVGADDQIPEHKVGIVQLLDETMRKALEEAMAALEPLSEAELVALIDGATALCAAEPRLLLLKGKLAAVGDLHECVASQFAALLAAKELHRVLTGNQFERVVLFLGALPCISYSFVLFYSIIFYLGDYADRGGYKHLGLNVLAINCALKVLNPEKVRLHLLGPVLAFFSTHSHLLGVFTSRQPRVARCCGLLRPRNCLGHGSPSSTFPIECLPS